MVQKPSQGGKASHSEFSRTVMSGLELGESEWPKQAIAIASATWRMQSKSDHSAFYRITSALGGVRCRTYDRQVIGSTPGRVTNKWLLLGWVTVCGQVNHLGI